MVSLSVPHDTRHPPTYRSFCGLARFQGLDNHILASRDVVCLHRHAERTGSKLVTSQPQFITGDFRELFVERGTIPTQWQPCKRGVGVNGGVNSGNTYTHKYRRMHIPIREGREALTAVASYHFPREMP